MTLPYKRNFTIGRQSEQFLNDEFHVIFEALKNINYRKNENRGEEPTAKVDGALWFDKPDEALKYWDTRTLTWSNLYAKKFQLIDQILNVTMPSDPVTGQLWLYNGVLMYFDGSKWEPVKTMVQDETQWSNAAFEDYMIITPLNAEGGSVVDDGLISSEEIQKYLKSGNDDTHKNTNFIEPVAVKWGEDGFAEPEIDEPTAPEVPGDDLRSQFIIPNLSTDRVFIDTDHDKSYEEISKICFQYPTKDIYNKTVSGIHLNPGKLSKITKRLIKVDKLNPIIAINAYNTEFYGFRRGEYGGNFLIESNNQDTGDYIPDGDQITLNYNAAQNYDYILAITFEFTWYKSNGSLNHYTAADGKNSFFLSNLRDVVNVHVNGLKLEEAAYDIDLTTGTVTIDDEDADKVDVQMWAPYKKQYGYIRETDLEGNGIIHLHQKVSIPLVFVGGTLIHPLYGGLQFDGDTIIIPNHTGIDSMKNLPWCVVDLYSGIGTDYMYSEKGTVTESEASFILGEQDYLDGQGNFIMHGTLSETMDKDGFRDFILASGILSGTNGNVIKYDNTIIGKDDGIILFVDGLMINDEDIVRDHANGTITLKPELVKGQEYVLLRDHDKRLYTTSDSQAAFVTGYIDDSLVYLNGKLLVNDNCVTTTSNENDEVANGAVYNEIKYFIPDEFSEDNGTWKLYDEYNYEWDIIPEDEIKDIKLIVSSYSNMISSIKININYDEETDDLHIYSFKLSSSISGILKIGTAEFIETDKDDGLQIWATGSDAFAYGQGVLNLYRNGIKMIPNIDYRELSENNYVKMITPVELTDIIQYVIEPIETGETYGHEFILMTPENVQQPNIYKLEDGDNVPDLYPGRLTVYINGVRLPNEDWTLLDNKRIMLRYTNFKMLGSSGNYPDENYVLDNGNQFTITHNYPDYLCVEIRKDYDRQERTIEIGTTNNMELYPEDFGINMGLLETADEILFYLNGQFCGLTRNKKQDYKLDKYKNCIAFLNTDFLEAITTNPLKSLFNKNALVYAAWKKQTGKDEYVSSIINKLTIVWR